MADTQTGSAPNAQTTEAMELSFAQRRIDRIQPGTTVEEMKQHVRDAADLLNILDNDNTTISQISDTVKSKLATIPTIATPETEDETKIIDALFLGIMSAKKLLKLKGTTTQFDDQIAVWEVALNNPRYKRDYTTVLKLKDLLRSVQEKI